MTTFLSIEKQVGRASERNIDEEFHDDFMITSMYFAQLAYFSPKYIQTRLIHLGAETISIYSRNGVQAVVAEFESIVVVSFKGREADRWQEIRTDLKFWSSDFKGYQVHSGFLESLQFVSKRVLIDMEELDLDKRIIYVGHSLGGALAYLMALEFKPNDVVTFGSPRVFKTKAVHQYFSGINTIRVVSDNDFVPGLPPEFIGFFHIGQEIVIPGVAGKWNSHKLRTYMKGLLKEFK